MVEDTELSHNMFSKDIAMNDASAVFTQSNSHI